MQRLDHLEDAKAPEVKLNRGVERLTTALNRLGEREQSAIPNAGAGVPDKGTLPPPRPSAADSITPESIEHLSWDEIGELYTRHGDDPEAIEKLSVLVDEREARESEAGSEFETWQVGDPPFGGGDWVSNPTLRPQRKLTPHEVAREEYEHYMYSQYAKCESELSFLVNKQGVAKGVDSLSLFSGPVSRVKKYGTEELQAWFALNGRHTLASFRHAMYGWASDAKAARNKRLEGYENVAHVI